MSEEVKVIIEGVFSFDGWNEGPHNLERIENQIDCVGLREVIRDDVRIVSAEFRKGKMRLEYECISSE